MLFFFQAGFFDGFGVGSMFDSMNKFQDNFANGFKSFGGLSSGNGDGTITVNGGAYSAGVDVGGIIYEIKNDGQTIIVISPNGSKQQVTPRSDGKVDVSQYTKNSYKITLSGYRGTLIIKK